MSDKEKIAEINRRHYVKNREALLKKKAELRAKDPEVYRLRWREYYHKNSEANMRRHAEYVAKNRDAVNKRSRERRRENPSERAASSQRSRVWSILKHGSIPRTGSIGLRQAALKEWLEAKFESGMTWENYGSAWHVDHIIPCAAFDLTKPRELRKCFHYHNLRPCWAEENRRKSDKVLTQSELEFAA